MVWREVVLGLHSLVDDDDYEYIDMSTQTRKDEGDVSVK